jgi:NAD(P)-dependent dehydrogenase (short-subunit alcohol dehydrogenase family)
MLRYVATIVVAILLSAPLVAGITPFPASFHTHKVQKADFAGGVVRDNKEVNKFLASQTALGRVGLPDDIGGAVASLLADDNLWITGQRIEASGGTFL